MTNRTALAFAFIGIAVLVVLGKIWLGARVPDEEEQGFRPVRGQPG